MEKRKTKHIHVFQIEQKNKKSVIAKLGLKSIIAKSGKKDLVWNSETTNMFVSVKGIPTLIIST